MTRILFALTIITVAVSDLAAQEKPRRPPNVIIVLVDDMGIPPGKSQPEPAMTIDLLSTIARLTGATLPEGKLDGKDISGLLFAEAGAKSPQEAYFFYWNNELQGVRSGPWKLYFPHTYRTLQGSQAGNDGKPGPYKEASTVGLELYNLDDDLSERNEVAARNPAVVQRLQALAHRMRNDLGDSLQKTRKKTD